MTRIIFSQKNISKTVITLIFVSMVSACGGGSGGGGDATNEDANGGSTTATTNSATIRWIPPLTNEDGTNLGDLAGYKVHYGTSQGSYPNIVVVSNNVTETTIDNLPGDTYYFVVTAHDVYGNDSAFSDPPVSKVIN